MYSNTWHDPLEFSHSHPHPLNSFLHSSQSRPTTPPPYTSDVIIPNISEDLDHTYDHIFMLEQEFCSSFLCCGLHLSGLHELLDHFEESHVLVLAKDGRPIYPIPVPNPNSITPSSSSSSRKRPPFDHPEAFSSIVISYPQPYPPLTLDANLPHPSGPPTPSSPQPRAARNRSQSIYTDVLPSFDSGEQDVEPTFSHHNSATPRDKRHDKSRSPSLAHNSTSTASPPDSDTIHDSGSYPPSHRDRSTCPETFPSSRNHHSIERKRSVIKLKFNPSKTRATSSNRNHSTYGRSSKLDAFPNAGHPKKRDREKIYKCPHKGCSKAYLNPNGLKYHLERGKCTTPSLSYSSSVSSISSPPTSPIL